MSFFFIQEKETSTSQLLFGKRRKQRNEPSFTSVYINKTRRPGIGTSQSTFPPDAHIPAGKLATSQLSNRPKQFQLTDYFSRTVYRILGDTDDNSYRRQQIKYQTMNGRSFIAKIA